MSRSSLLQQLRHVAVGAAKHVYTGLVYVGSSAAPGDVDAILRHDHSSAGADTTTVPAVISADRPMLGHPERLIPNQPLTKVERHLWRQLVS